MIKIIRGKYGPKLLGPGTILNLDASDEQRLVKSNIAEYVLDASDDTINEDSEVDVKSMEELQKIRAKKELINYAESIGFHDLDEKTSRKDMIEAILNYQEEELDPDDQEEQIEPDASDEQECDIFGI